MEEETSWRIDALFPGESYWSSGKMPYEDRESACLVAAEMASATRSSFKFRIVLWDVPVNEKYEEGSEDPELSRGDLDGVKDGGE